MLTGRCHCGQVTWDFDADPGTVTACNCTICAKAGVLWIYGTDGDTARITGETKAYIRPDHGTLEFHHCPTCGNTIAWRMVDRQQKNPAQCALNLRLVDDPEQVMSLPIRHFDGRNTWRAHPDDQRTVQDMWY